MVTGPRIIWMVGYMAGLCLWMRPGIVQASPGGHDPRAGSRTEAACHGELKSRGVDFSVPDRAYPGVAWPVGVRSLGGVALSTPARRRRRKGNKRFSQEPTVMDCRLAEALVPWFAELRRHRVNRVVHFSVYRKGATIGRSRKVSGHARGLAVDVARFFAEDGERLDVLEHWSRHGRRQAPCPVRAEEPRPQRLLRRFVCKAIELNRFHVVLTPHHDRAHRNHVHLEIRPGATWTFIE